MASGSDGSDPGFATPSEPNFADVMNAFSFDSGRSSKRRKWGRRRGEDVERTDDTPETATTPSSGRATTPPRPAAARPLSRPVEYPVSGPADLADPHLAQPAQSVAAAAVRPYAWTRGRTKSGFDLAIETLLSTSQRGREQMTMLPVEHRAVAQLCEQTRSVAEVAALLSIPLGVARVVLGDMAGLGLVMVHQTVTSAGSGPDIALIERVLSGLRRL